MGCVRPFLGLKLTASDSQQPLSSAEGRKPEIKDFQTERRLHTLIIETPNPLNEEALSWKSNCSRGKSICYPPIHSIPNNKADISFCKSIFKKQC